MPYRPLKARCKCVEFSGNIREKYDASIFSSPNFARHLPIPQFIISPSIDPLSDKNKELPEETIDAVLNRYGISRINR